MQNASLRIGIIGFDGVNAIDVAGATELFASSRDLGLESAPNEPPCYEVVILGVSKKAFVADSGLVFQPHRTLAQAPKLDTVIIPGGSGLRVPKVQAAIAAWLR